jgi:glycosyltransferase involved in cell wall biosynthesis
MHQAVKCYGLPSSGHEAEALVVYARADPAMAWLFAALGDLVPTRCVSGEKFYDLARLVVSGQPFDPAAPLPMPLVPFGNPWRTGLHGPLLRLAARDVRTMILTRPDQSPLVNVFPNARKIYYAVDDYATYRRDWLGEERRILAAADNVVAVSAKLGETLNARFQCKHLTISPNAIPAEWIPSACPDGPNSLPNGFSLPRPIAGVLGRVSSRLRLNWLSQAIDRTPWLHWLFVGDTEESELLDSDRPTLARLHRHPRCCFVGRRGYDAMAQFAAALDLAVLPYSDRSTNPLGSSMRLFLHLPYAAPIVATPGCLQLEEFPEILTMCGSADALERELSRLRTENFDDGRRKLRWQMAHANTWERRAQTIADLIKLAH